MINYLPLLLYFIADKSSIIQQFRTRLDIKLSRTISKRCYYFIITTIT